MMPEPIQRHKTDWLLSLCFALLIAIPLGGSIFGWDFYEPQSENRVMATFPDLRNTPVSLLPEKMEAY
ncbi:MAG TPA: hypothetical protein VLL07_04655, partial [Pontiella sp.]|nr:hypothetical protein [Pontiella sp.]